MRGREGERVRRRGRGGDEEEGERVRRRGRGGDEEEGKRKEREGEERGEVQRVKQENLPTSAVREAIPPKMKGFSVFILV